MCQETLLGYVRTFRFRSSQICLCLREFCLLCVTDSPSRVQLVFMMKLFVFVDEAFIQDVVCAVYCEGIYLPSFLFPPLPSLNPLKRLKLCIALYGNSSQSYGGYLPHGITLCYLPPDASERAPP